MTDKKTSRPITLFFWNCLNFQNDRLFLSYWLDRTDIPEFYESQKVTESPTTAVIISNIIWTVEALGVLGIEIYIGSRKLLSSDNGQLFILWTMLSESNKSYLREVSIISLVLGFVKRQ